MSAPINNMNNQYWPTWQAPTHSMYVHQEPTYYAPEPEPVVQKYSLSAATSYDSKPLYEQITTIRTDPLKANYGDMSIITKDRFSGPNTIVTHEVRNSMFEILHPRHLK